MSRSIYLYKSVLIQVPDRPEATVEYFGCKNHSTITFGPNALFCIQCGLPLKRQVKHLDLEYIQGLISEMNVFHQTVTFSDDEGFINISIYDTETDELDPNDSFITDDDNDTITWIMSPKELDKKVEDTILEYSNFINQLKEKFGMINISPSITRILT